MKKNSLVVQYIDSHENWKEDFKKMGIKVHYDGDLAIFKYGIECDFSNPIVQEARGIIIDMVTRDVVCWAYNKIGNYNESYADDIDWNSARVQEKVDGSIIKLYWYNNKWNWATNGVIYAKNAEVPNIPHTSYEDLIKASWNYNELQFNHFNKNYTYIFELVSPLTKIVVDYKRTMLYHTGTRNNITGEELIEDIGIQKPAEYPLQSFADALAAAQVLNTKNPDAALEGFVVVDKNWHRIKIKTPEYLAAHHVWSNNTYLLPKKTAVELALDQSWNDIQGKHSPYMSQIHWYQYQISLLEWNVQRYLVYVRSLYKEFSHERAAVAKIIKNQPLATFGFKGIDNNKTGYDIVHEVPRHVIIKFLEDYKLPDFLEQDIYTKVAEK